MKERELREQMERELRAKEQQLVDVTRKQSELELKLLRVNMNETETKNENDRLQKVSSFQNISFLFIYPHSHSSKKFNWKNNYKRLQKV